uniref:Uncharacterized protein n=1 Tax=Romanomermis culicivorax TaxID=13658 RepID=A0A915J4I0_ROMCU
MGRVVNGPKASGSSMKNPGIKRDERRLASIRSLLALTELVNLRLRFLINLGSQVISLVETMPIWQLFGQIVYIRLVE